MYSESSKHTRPAQPESPTVKKTTNPGADLSRRKFLVGAAGAVAATPFVTNGLYSASGAADTTPGSAATVKERRKLGTLEVSASGWASRT